MNGESEPPATAPETTTTTTSSLGFRLLSRVHGQTWLSAIKKNTPKFDATLKHTSSVDSSIKQHTTAVIMDDVMSQSTSNDAIQGILVQNASKQQQEIDVSNKVIEETCMQKANADVDVDTSFNEKMMINDENNSINVSVIDCNDRVLNDDEEKQNGKDCDERNEIRGTDERGNNECENGDSLHKLSLEVGELRSSEVLKNQEIERLRLCLKEAQEQLEKQEEAHQQRLQQQAAEAEDLKRAIITLAVEKQWLLKTSVEKNVHSEETLIQGVADIRNDESADKRPEERNVTEKVSNIDDTNHIQKEIEVTNQLHRIMEKGCENERTEMSIGKVFADQLDDELKKKAEGKEATHCVNDNSLGVLVSDHTHRVQNDDEQHEKGKDYDDTRCIQEHEVIKNTDQREIITEECQNGDNFIHRLDKDVQNKKIVLASGKTSGLGHDSNNMNVEGKKVDKLDNATIYSESGKHTYGNVPWKIKHRFGSGSNTTKKADKTVPKKRASSAKRMSFDENGSLCRVQSNVCHQCHRNDKGRVVRCQMCDNKRYCVPCMNTWYPNMTEDMFAERCPVCRGNCNCKPCLSDVYPWVNDKIHFITNNDQKVECSKNILQMMLPFLKHLNEERLREMEIEAEIKGCSISEVKLKKADDTDCRIYCDCCKTTILDLHRSCPRCEYDLCLTCCRELRDGQLQGYKKAVTTSFTDPGPSYMHGESQNSSNKTDAAEPAPEGEELPEWKSLKNSSIRCPPRSLGGCRLGILELKHLLPLDMVPSLLEKSQELLKSKKLMECMPRMRDSANENDGGNKHLCKASSRENSNDNYLYCPSAVDIESGGLKHFQCHWARGEPVMVSNVLAMGLGLSWEPTIMSRSNHQATDTMQEVVNCLDWQSVDINYNNFFKWYMEGRYDDKGWPQILKLTNYPLSKRHGVEFISCLPFKQYTHPHDGYCNLATKLPDNCLEPHTQISYGFAQELGRGDSVTKLHFNMSDVVNVLTHTATVTLGLSQLRVINRLKRKHMAQDHMEFFGGGKVMKRMPPLDDITTNSEGLDLADGGALWDIFRREDTPKLELYLKKHFKEFRHVFCLPLQQVIHPIHDQTFYLTMDQKRRLKEEFGIEPWTVVQKLGDAVFIPAGCAHQVRNLKSCTSVTLDFFSPESFTECIRLNEDLRVLPQNHRAKEDKLEVKKMALYAVEEAVRDLQDLKNDKEHQGYTDQLKSARKKPRKEIAMYTSSTTVGLPRNQVKTTAIMDVVSDNLPQEKPIQGMFNTQNKEHSTTRSGSGHDPNNKKDNKKEGKTEATQRSKEKAVIDYNHVKQKKDGNLVKESGSLMDCQQGTNDKTSSCDDDEPQEVIYISDDDADHIQRHQRVKEMEQEENVLVSECENRKIQDAQNKKIQLSSRKRTRASQQNMEKDCENERSKRSTSEIFTNQFDEEEQRRNAEGKRDSKLDEESFIQRDYRDNDSRSDVDKNDETMLDMDAVMPHSTNEENNAEVEAMHCTYSSNDPVDDHTHREQNDDEQQQKGKDFDDTVQEHQGTKDTDQQEILIEACENGQNKKIQLDSGKTSDSGHGDAINTKEGQFGSGYNVERNKADKTKPKKNVYFSRHNSMDEYGNRVRVRSTMCHQCQRNDKGRVVECLRCYTKRYCEPCMTTWYPTMTQEMFAECCPVCLGICNCKQCLRNACPSVKKKIDFVPNDDQKVQGSVNILQTLLPFLKCINEEHVREIETEAEIKGCSTSEVKLKKADCKSLWIYCDYCRTSILDLLRNCPRCQYDLCLACCREFRDGQLQGYRNEVICTIIDPDPEHKVKKIAEWKPLKNGSIRCPPKSLGGCSCGILELVHVWTLEEVQKLTDKAHELLKSNELIKYMDYMLKIFDSVDENDVGNMHLRKAASRENSNDNYLYCPSAVDNEAGGLNNFQRHWSKGEPVIVSDVLAVGLGLSWEPMVMYRSFRQISNVNHDKHLDAKAINCLDWHEVDISLINFFKGYVEGLFENDGWPRILKLNDCPPSDRHTVEFISSLPFKQYTHPRDGYLNLACKLPRDLKLDMGPKTHISYGFTKELGRGDSVTKLQFNISDVVNVLTHTATVTLDSGQRKAIDKLRRHYRAQDQMELFGEGEKMAAIDDVITDSEGLDMADGGALWDIFRREDTPKLELYLKKHFKEFRHISLIPLQQVIHPIHEKTFYLTVDHKKRLKEEFGIEPWTFVQKLGDAVFIPVGCAHQVRYLKSCTNVAVGFVSPESFTECLKLTEERRLLSKNHWAKTDNLQVKKMALYAVDNAVKDLNCLLFPEIDPNSAEKAYVKDRGGHIRRSKKRVKMRRDKVVGSNDQH
ncbi:hypothetical protein QVD17_37871 [Tagetes erecta]|uniref:Uncharacterized protein n=1 Tax=Tagetes erecta TaxID=13708 RepID=A0AAD8JWW3_TARER|nr:hypothetical protein QVD17_37871 [Tagetes erecta]